MDDRSRTLRTLAGIPLKGPKLRNVSLTYLFNQQRIKEWKRQWKLSYISLNRALLQGLGGY